jgi:MFS family permease
MVIVNTIVIVRDQLGFGQSAVALTLASYGGGSMLAALLLPRLLDRLSDRSVMIAAACALAAGLAIMAALTTLLQHFGIFWHIVLASWFLLGVAYSASVTPSGRLLRRSANADDRPAVFAAQFALSHCCWLIAYPLAGQIGAGYGQAVAFGTLAILAGLGVVTALTIWPANESGAVPHSHDDLPPDHPHLREGHGNTRSAEHDFVIDNLHTVWPRQ